MTIGRVAVISAIVTGAAVIGGFCLEAKGFAGNLLGEVAGVSGGLFAATLFVRHQREKARKRVAHPLLEMLAFRLCLALNRLHYRLGIQDALSHGHYVDACSEVTKERDLQLRGMATQVRNAAWERHEGNDAAFRPWVQEWMREVEWGLLDDAFRQIVLLAGEEDEAYVAPIVQAMVMEARTVARARQALVAYTVTEDAILQGPDALGEIARA